MRLSDESDAGVVHRRDIVAEIALVSFDLED